MSRRKVQRVAFMWN